MTSLRIRQLFTRSLQWTTKMTICAQNVFSSPYKQSFISQLRIFANTSYKPMMRNTFPFKWGFILLFVTISVELGSYFLRLFSLFYFLYSFSFWRQPIWEHSIAVKAISKFRQTHLSNSTGRTIRKTLRWKFYISLLFYVWTRIDSIWLPFLRII